MTTPVNTAETAKNPAATAANSEQPTNGAKSAPEGARKPEKPTGGKVRRKQANKPASANRQASKLPQKAESEGEKHVRRLIEEELADRPWKLSVADVEQIERIIDRRTEPTPRTPLIFGAIRNAMRDIMPLAKTEHHPDLGFDFRRMDIICAAMQPILVAHGIFYSAYKILKVEQVERPAVNYQTGETWANIFTNVTVQWRVYSAIDGSFIECESAGEAMSEQHFSTPASQTMAEKTMLCDLFCIPIFGEVDPEAITGERSQTSTPKQVYVAPESTAPAPRPAAAQAPTLFGDMEPEPEGYQERKTDRKKRGKGLEPQVASVGGAPMPEIEPDAKTAPGPATEDKPVSPGFIRILGTSMTAKGVTAEQVCEHFKVAKLDDILTSQMNEAMGFISTATKPEGSQQ